MMNEVNMCSVNMHSDVQDGPDELVINIYVDVTHELMEAYTTLDVQADPGK